MNKNKDKIWSVGMLFIGVIFGITGSLLANMIDRYMIRWGVWYDFVVAVAFLLMVIFINRFFTKMLLK